MLAAILSNLQWSSLLTHPMAIILGIAIVAAFAATVVIWPSPARASRVPVRQRSTAEPPGSSIPPVILPFRQTRPAPVKPQTERGEKRRALRRKGQPVPVLVTHFEKPGLEEVGWVMDRSQGGLRLIFTRSLPAGDELSVRAENASDDMPWVALRVKHCRQSGKRWIIGCEFVDALPWSVLLLFG
jgi:hypothetical protein